ncbi:dTDP-4-dehydrorhamnose reductase [Spiribacter insolitus]|uniref:dTDP-4-dehydrorhamnose reductase n=1 Tax=Spiribacter insolitus TaxID=3122417 RepID=A0ABV3T3M3_9GAMM
MRIALLGASGQVGFELRRALAPLGEVVLPDRTECDLSDRGALRRGLMQLAPDAIVNAAAYTGVDDAETHREVAFRINGEAPGVIGEAARETGAFVVHYSTDYVFSGDRDRAYREEDPTSPLNVYGESKRLGEVRLAESGAAFYLFRTAWVISPRGRNFLQTILRLAAERDRLQVVSDQLGAPTSAALIADVTAHALHQRLSGRGSAEADGIYHLTASGSASWFEVARYIVETACGLGFDLRLAAEAIEPIRAAEYGQAALRPSNSRLDTTRLTSQFGLTTPDWRDGIHWALEQLR